MSDKPVSEEQEQQELQEKFGPCKTCGEVPLSGECLDMVRECLEGLGKDMSAVPAMFYPEAIRSLIFNTLKDAGVFPGHPAKYRYVPGDDGSFKKVVIPTEHHIWCNGLPSSPVAGCRWCDPPEKAGLWETYPYNTPEEAAGLVKQHFPDAIERK